jgi:hypothetical protein
MKLPNGADFCLHSDVEAAYDTLDRLRRMVTDYDARVVLTHGAEWIEEGDDGVLMSFLSDEMKGEWIEKVRAGDAP